MPQKLPYEEFLKTFEKVPRVAISLFILNKNGEFLLTKRSIPPEKDTWHLPGSFILKDEKVEECIKRILKNEVGFEGNFAFQIEQVSENLDKDPRGHVIDMIYRVEGNIVAQATEESSEVGYFFTLPENIGFNHRDVLNSLGLS